MAESRLFFVDAAVEGAMKQIVNPIDQDPKLERFAADLDQALEETNTGILYLLMAYIEKRNAALSQEKLFDSK